MFDRLRGYRLILAGFLSLAACGLIYLLLARMDGLTDRQRELKHRFDGWFKGWGERGPPGEKGGRFEGDYTGYAILSLVLVFAEGGDRDRCDHPWIRTARMSPAGHKWLAAEIRRTCPFRIYIYGRNLVVVGLGDAMPMTDDPVSSPMRHGVERIHFTRIDGIPTSPNIDAEAKAKALKVLGLEERHDPNGDACALC